jgi:hypothetical protein
MAVVHAQASPGSGALLYRLNSGKKPYTQFQQLQTQQVGARIMHMLLLRTCHC